MAELSFEALLALIALCGGAGYLLGKDIHKAKSNCPNFIFPPPMLQY